MFYFDGATLAHVFLLVLEYISTPDKQTDTSKYQTNRATEVGRSNLKRIWKQIDENNAIQVEQELGELSYFITNPLMEHLTNIPKDKVSESLEKYKKRLTNEDRKRIIESIFQSGENLETMAHWDFRSEGSQNSKIHYGIVAHSNSPDGKHVDLFIAIYDVDFKMKNNVLQMKDIRKMKNFFRYMAINEFESEGLVNIKEKTST